jgi:NADPH-dependent curcumin reductase CurA
MAPQKTRQWILENPPAKDIVLEGSDATFKLETVELPEPGKDQVLVKTL